MASRARVEAFQDDICKISRISIQYQEIPGHLKILGWNSSTVTLRWQYWKIHAQKSKNSKFGFSSRVLHQLKGLVQPVLLQKFESNRTSRSKVMAQKQPNALHSDDTDCGDYVTVTSSPFEQGLSNLPTGGKAGK